MSPAAASPSYEEGDVVPTPYGPGIVMEECRPDGFVELHMGWGTVYFRVGAGAGAGAGASAGAGLSAGAGAAAEPEAGTDSDAAASVADAAVAAADAGSDSANADPGADSSADAQLAHDEQLAMALQAEFASGGDGSLAQAELHAGDQTSAVATPSTVADAGARPHAAEAAAASADDGSGPSSWRSRLHSRLRRRSAREDGGAGAARRRSSLDALAQAQGRIDPDHMSYDQLLQLDDERERSRLLRRRGGRTAAARAHGGLAQTHYPDGTPLMFHPSARGAHPSQIHSLPIIEYKGRRRTDASDADLDAPTGASDDAGDDAEKCLICREEFEVGDSLRLLPCMHKYHCRCCDPWLLINRVCPVCQHTIDME